jgi:hypothetical protein
MVAFASDAVPGGELVLRRVAAEDSGLSI